MANTYTLIASNTLGASAASVTFSSIPNTYTDLVLRASIRSDRAAAADRYKLQFNSDTAGNYSATYLSSDATSAGSGRQSVTTYIEGVNAVNGDTSTSSTFSTIELYIPSYTVSQNKPLSAMQAQENNNSTAFMYPTAGLWRNTAAITSMVFSPIFGTNFLSGSSFFLYGIKNS